VRLLFKIDHRSSHSSPDQIARPTWASSGFVAIVITTQSHALIFQPFQLGQQAAQNQTIFVRTVTSSRRVNSARNSQVCYPVLVS
jgi:hypothetical protein